MSNLTPELLLNAYANGYFPMADSRDAKELFWYQPEERGVLPLEAFHVPGSLKKFMRHMPYRITMDQDFRSVITACAELTTERDNTWINDEIIDIYCELHRLGFAHSVEVWEDETLVGGLYGVALQRAFFGESMFSRRSNASKVALVALVNWLQQNGFELLDTQYVNDHLLQFGVVAIPCAAYLERLRKSLA